MAKNNFLTTQLITIQIGMLATISAQSGNQVRIIISVLENEQVIIGMGIRQLFREQPDSITSYFVRFNILYFYYIQNRVYQQQPQQPPFFFDYPNKFYQQ